MILRGHDAGLGAAAQGQADKGLVQLGDGGGGVRQISADVRLLGLGQAGEPAGNGNAQRKGDLPDL